ncbi:GNAT family N-acetyltransferase [Oricola sp.]|uniref:GNAT family N-acetyltransferase n=1 Tax=Oricola sp. TaxID=1979950 RepID=UPI0025FEFFC9|nr:GNAT family N-acetyltransferase [Oricola sp.]MCI5075705.1 GNAT family N-acetyltransferase [Oricola sp.]
MMRVETERLIMRPWEERDRDLFYEINSDPEVMAFFPMRRTREQADAFFDTLLDRQKNRVTFSALELRETGKCIGFCGLHEDNIEPHFPAGTVEIGWRLVTRAWGKGYVTEGARAALAYGFTQMGLAEIVSFAVHDNHRSTAVMERIGMRRDPGSDFDYFKIPDTHPHLKRHVVYRISAEDWRSKKGGH